jgi:hypothetical protein
MCLLTEQKEPKIAETDITVYKIVELQSTDLYAYAIFRNFTYETNVIYNIEIEETDDIDNISWFDDEVGQKYLTSDGIPIESISRMEYKRLYITNKLPFKIFGQGFHSAKTRKRLTPLFNGRIAVFIIPKGSKYYEDKSDLLVSDKIKFTGKFV